MQILQGSEYSDVIETNGQWTELNVHIAELESELNKYKRLESLSNTLSDEIKVLFPYIRTVSLSRCKQANIADTTQQTVIIAVLESDRVEDISVEKKQKIQQWLQARTKENQIKIYLTE